MPNESGYKEEKFMIRKVMFSYHLFYRIHNKMGNSEEVNIKRPSADSPQNDTKRPEVVKEKRNGHCRFFLFSTIVFSGFLCLAQIKPQVNFSVTEAFLKSLRF